MFSNHQNLANKTYSFTVEHGQFDLNRTDWQNREREGTEERDEETASSRYFIFISFLSQPNITKIFRNIPLLSSPRIKGEEPFSEQDLFVIDGKCNFFIIDGVDVVTVQCVLLLLVLLFSNTARFGNIVQDIFFVLLIFLYQKHGFWHILVTVGTQKLCLFNCLNFILETNMFGYLFWKKFHFPTAKIFVKTFLGKYQIFLHQCILRILSCRELFSLPRCQKPERGPDYPDLYQPCWKQEQIRG